jgi:hypothetical protein
VAQSKSYHQVTVKTRSENTKLSTRSGYYEP